MFGLEDVTVDQIEKHLGCHTPVCEGTCWPQQRSPSLCLGNSSHSDSWLRAKPTSYFRSWKGR